MIGSCLPTSAVSRVYSNRRSTALNGRRATVPSAFYLEWDIKKLKTAFLVENLAAEGYGRYIRLFKTGRL